MSKETLPEFFQSTAREVAAERARRGISPDQRVTVMMEPAEEETLLDRTVFIVRSEAYASFMARLDESPKPNERLRRTMRSVPPWE